MHMSMETRSPIVKHSENTGRTTHNANHYKYMMPGKLCNLVPSNTSELPFLITTSIYLVLVLKALVVPSNMDKSVIV